MQQWQQYIVEHADVLGVSMGSKELSKKEKCRMEKARSILAMLGSIGLPRKLDRQYKQSLAMSTFAYGWLTKMPRLAAMGGIAAKMLAKGLRGGSKHLKFVLEGGTTHPLAVVTCRLANLLFKARRKEDGARVLVQSK